LDVLDIPLMLIINYAILSIIECELAIGAEWDEVIHKFAALIEDCRKEKFWI